MRAFSSGLERPGRELLTTLLKSPSVVVVGAAASALRSSPEPPEDAEAQALASLQTHGSAKARQAAAWALGHAPARSSTETLLALALDADDSVRQEARAVLMRYEPSTLHREALGKVVPRAVTALTEGERELRLAALELLGLIESALREGEGA